jgi:polyisoprenoid-binding protein YceI
MFTKKIISLFAVLLLTAGVTIGQTVQLNIHDSANMHIYGDSNIKTWDAAVNQVNGSLTLQNLEDLSAENLTAENFQSLSLTIPVEQIESESGGLTKNIHKYLKGDDYPNITFQLNNVTNITEQNGSLLITASGIVNAAGTDNPVEMQVTANVQNGTIEFSGTKELLMTDFNIDPPTAVFGTIRSKDEFRVEFNVSFSQEGV